VAEAEAIEGESQLSIFNELFESARKSALKSDKVIQGMLEVLRQG
jgi:hypothetical protein